VDSGIPREDVLVVNFEDPSFPDMDLGFLTEIYEAYEEIMKPKGKPYLFLDEIQEVAGWEKFVRTLNETKKARLVITGSSSKLMAEELATILTGRQLTYEIFPLSFPEFLRFKGMEIGSEKDIYLNAGDIRKFLWEYLDKGGFPEVFFIEEDEIKRRVLQDYYETILNRDIIARYRVREIGKLKTLARYYLTNISSPVTHRKTGRFSGIPAETVRRFSEHIQTAKLIFFVSRFSFSLKEQDISPKKVYAIDVGLANAVGFRFRENFGRLMENVVAIELQRRKSENPLLEVFYYRDQMQHEVDFVIKEGLDVRQLIQVCYDVDDFNVKERELRVLLKASRELDCGDLLVITWDYEAEEEVSWRGIMRRVKFVPLWRWLLIA